MNTTANDIPPTFQVAPPRERPKLRKYPDPDTDLGKAWAAAWRELRKAGPEFLDGVELATRSAQTSGLKDSTMVTLFTRAATAGVLERTHRPTKTTRGTRNRTWYRLPQECPECAEYSGTGGEDITCATCGKPGRI
jgi:hypothetical protein